MISDYTKEIGLPSQKKTMPRSVAIAILALVAIGASFGVAQVVSAAKEHGAAEKPAAAAPAK